MPKIARLETENDAAGNAVDPLPKIATRMAPQTTRTAGDEAQDAAQHAGDAAPRIRDTFPPISVERGEISRMFVDLLAEQARHNMDAAAALGRSMNLIALAKVQREFIAGSFERMNKLGERYRESVRTAMSGAAFDARR